MPTHLLYLEQMNQYTCPAQVIAVIPEEEKTTVTLDQTVFYPQGGGQPYDNGIITSEDGKKFLVQEVRFSEGTVQHIGTFESEPFQPHQKVECSIDVERRQLHAKLHSAGHVVDMALKQLGIPWIPGKGHHFPDGPYVEYAGRLDNMDIETFRNELETICNTLITKGVETKVLFMPKEEMSSVCSFVPDFIPKDKPGRVVMYGNFGVPCGGTHVGNLKDIGAMIIRKIKQNGPNIKISYLSRQDGDALG